MRPKQRNHRARDLRRIGESIDHGVDREAHPGLAQVAIECTHPIGLTRQQTRAYDQPVKRIVFLFT